MTVASHVETDEPIGIDVVRAHIVGTLEGVAPADAWGETSFFYNPGMAFRRGCYFATVKEKDGANDRASSLDRPGVWRLNIGVSRAAYLELFGPPPPRPAKGGVVEGPWDFTARDAIMPHPVYGWMGWVAVLTPSIGVWRRCQPLIADAHARAKATFDARSKRSGAGPASA